MMLTKRNDVDFSGDVLTYDTAQESNPRFKLEASASAGYTDVSSIINFNAFGFYVGNDETIRDEIDILFQATTWAALTTPEKEIVSKYFLTTKVNRDTVHDAVQQEANANNLCIRLFLESAKNSAIVLRDVEPNEAADIIKDSSASPLTNWKTPSVNWGDGSTIGVSVFINDDNIGKYYSFDGASDDVISFDWDLENNGIAYDGSDLVLELFGRLSANGVANDTIGWILEYHFVDAGDDLVSGGTTEAQVNYDVSTELANIGFETTLNTMTGVAGATRLLVTFTRNASGASQDAFSGNWEGLGIKLNKV